MTNNESKKIMDYFEKLGFTLWSEDGKLRYKAPQTVLTPENINKLKENKELIINYLKNNKTIKNIEITENIEARYEEFPMTDVQSAYVLGRKDTFKYGNVACHVYLEIDYKEELQINKVKKAWDKLIARHDMLRAVMYENGYQKVLETVPSLEIPFYDMADGASTKEVDKLKEEMSHRVYPLGKWPMFGVAITKKKNISTMHFSIEFLVADWTSIWSLLRQFETVYFGLDIKLEDVRLRFRDYVLAERKLKESSRYLKDRDYWLSKIDSFPLAPKLPILKNSEDKPRFKRRFLNMGIDKWTNFKNHARKSGVTPTAAVLAVYADVIEKWSNNNRFCLNLTVLNRMPLHPEISSVIGDFTSINLLEVNNDSSKAFSERAKDINMRLFEDLDHRLFSGIEVIREISRKKGREASIMPIVFTSAIGLINNDKEKMKGNISGEGISQTPQVFIDCQAMDGDFGLQINWDYREGIYHESMIRDMFSIFETKLNKLADSLSEWSVDNHITLPKWQTDLLVDVNNTKTKMPEGLLYTKFIENVAKNPEKIAVIDERGSYTYSEINKRAIEVAQKIKQRGFKQENIAIVMEKSMHQVVSVLAVLFAGCVYVPVDANQAKKRRNTIIENVGAKIVLTTSGSDHDYEGIEIINVDEVTATEKEFKPEDISSDSPAYIIYTSGSTGVPKGVVITHSSALNTIEDINNRFNITDKDRALGLSQLNFDLSVYDIFGMLSIGGSIVYPSNERYADASHWVELINKHSITTINSVPAFMKILLMHLKADEKISVPSLRLSMMSGDWIPLQMPDELIERVPNIKIVSLGGATEASIWSNYHEYKCLEENWVSIPYGKPLNNQGFRILDKNMNDCPIFVAGDLYITGKGLALGYYNDEKLTKEKFFTHPNDGQMLYKTGDLGRYLENGEIEFLGRSDNQIKIRGHRIELGEIENAIMDHKAVDRSVVCVSQDVKIGQEKKLYGFAEVKSIDDFKEEYVYSEFSKDTNDIEDEVSNIIKKLLKQDIEKTLDLRDKAALMSMLYGLQKLGILTEERYYNIDDILDCEQISEKYRWLVRHWLVKLEKEGYLDKKSDSYKAKIFITEQDYSKAWSDIREVWTDDFGTTDFINYVKSNTDKLVGLLKNEVDPVALLYPEGKRDYTEALYVKNTMAIYLNKCICEFVKRIANNNPNKTLRVLEVGAGTGATAKHVLEALNGYNFEYHYTDVLKYFLPSAKERFSHLKEVKFSALDIDRDIREQGFLPNSFDIVIGAYVLENAKDIAVSMDRIEELLAPGGYFLFTEPVKEEPWILASQAFMMMRPEDEIRKDVAFIELDDWIKLLNRRTSEDSLKVIPSKEDRLSRMGLNLFIKQFKVDKQKVRENEIKEHLEKALPEYMIPISIQLVDKLPITSNGKIDRKQVQNLIVSKQETVLGSDTENNEMDEMDKELSKIVGKVFKVDFVGKNQNFYDFGADSLSLAEVSTQVRSSIAKDIPFDTVLRHMLNHPTIAQLSKFIKNSAIGNNAKDEVAVAKGEDEKTHNAVIRKYSEGKTDTLRVVFHGAFGMLNSFRHLIPELAKQQKGQVIGIGIEDIDKYCEMDAASIIDNLADDYTKLLLETESENMQLVGYSLGGLVAVEVAKRLIENGIDIKDLVIIDSQTVPYEINDEIMMELLFADTMNVSIKDIGIENELEYDEAIAELLKANNNIIMKDALSNLKGNNERIKISEAISKLSSLDKKERFKKYIEISERKTGNKADLNVIQRMYKTFKQSYRAMNYLPDAYVGDIRFLYAKEVEGLFKYKHKLLENWKEMCLGDLSIIEIEGNHYTCIEDKANSLIVAKHINEALKSKEA
ncbi:amino acid adenylation domain-containing protein [Clostridiaceae bacterium M8S5]|nr:amino acid adenylation domain-containing protein [Clostridiaceae bacterium M8S5]